MAGESPGKSDQQKSSGETARGARDPRLTASREEEADDGRSAIAVAEDAASGGSGAASTEPESESERPESGVRESESGEPGATETESGLPVRPGASAEGDSSSPDATDESGETAKPEGSDTRLREAVAAWVASDEPDAEADSEAEAEGESSAAPGGTEGGATDAAAEDDSDASDSEASGTSRPAKAGADAEGDAGTSGAKGNAAAEGGAGEGETSDGPSERAGDDGVARAASGADKGASGDAEGSGASRPAKAGADAESDDDASGAEGEAASKGGADDSAAEGRAGGGKLSDVPSERADTDGDDDAAKAASGDESESGDAGASGAEGDADGSAAKGGADASSGSSDEGSGAKGRAGASSGEGSGTSRSAKAGADAKGDADADAEDGDGAASEARGDQKTAVFRAPKVPSGGEGADSDAGEASVKAASGSKGAKADADASGGEGSGASRTAKANSGAGAADDAGEADSKGSDADDSGKAAASGDGKRRPAWAGADDDGDGDGKPSRPSVDQKTAVFRAPKVEDKEEKDGKGGKPVDRPTAAFGVLPEKKKGVDQPTTAIKALPSDAEKGGKGTKDGKDGAKPSERENERTSKFVPLRSSDAPAPAKAPAKASAKAPAKPDDVPETERTRQQPLPPQTPDGKQPAPLDLLAELTNRPPKPETPIRTAVRRVKIWTPLAILLVVLLGVAQAVRPLPEPELKLTADASYTFKGAKLTMPWSGEGQSAAEVQGVGSLGTSGAQKAVPIASVTKVMTAYVVLKDHPLKAGAEGPRIKIDKTAADESSSADESRASVKEGQSFTQHQLLQLLLINSSNNIARLLARWDAGSLDAFTKKMNDAAKSLGMKNTTYTDPSGLKESTKSTAADQLKLAAAAMESEAFREVVATPNTEIPGLDGKIYNNNNLLVKPGVIGIKTGSSTPAGGALMWGAVRTIDGKKQRILGVVLEQRAPTTLDASLQLAQTESYKLITAVQDALTSATVIKKGDVVGQVDDGLGGTTPVVATKDLKAVGWAGLNVDIKIGDGGKTIPHTAKAGTVVGEVTVGTGPGQVKAPVALENDLSEPSFGSKLTRIS
ncbi:D-alanyl-D-alanine carboxypeptidase [Streptomyces sp. NPDC059850]|uniref:D-alanyl-D-alanine carboxypeptidase n=1 Tax=Streptomyces sp. NPDC059850 TaxID=3346970 RepID=UPI00365E0B23